mgnify:CR=1 FL=1
MPKLENAAEGQGAKDTRKLLDLSCFGRPMIHFQTAQKLVVNNNCFEKLVWMSKRKRAIIHCDEYDPYALFVTKQKGNQVEYFKTMEEDCNTFSICTFKSFEKKGHSIMFDN